MFTKIIAILSIIISVITLFLTSPLIIEYYISSNLTYVVSEMSDGALKFELLNVGKRSAKEVRIELADRHRNKLIHIQEITVIPSKKHKINSQWLFQTISFEDYFFPKEEVYVLINSDIPKESYPFLWIRVTYDGREAKCEAYNLIQIE